jgi:O-antigen/teichoic acid export membrane protein
MLNSRFLLTNTRALQLFQLMRQGSLILIAIALAKSYLPKAEVGEYEMLTYVAYLLTFFWVAGAIQALLSYYPNCNEREQGQLISHSFGLFTIFSLIVGLLLGLFPVPLLNLLVQQDSLSYLPLFLVFLVTNIPASLQEHFYLLRGQATAIVVYGMLSAGAQLLALALPPLLGLDFVVSFQCLAVVGIIKWLWLSGYVLRHGAAGWAPHLLRGWWLLAWPLALYALLGAINLSVGPWMVGYFFAGDKAQFAIYRYGARELPLLSALTGAVSSALIPAIAASTTSGIEQLRKESGLLFHALFPVSILLLLTAPWWFVWVFDEAYAAAIPLFQTFLLLTPAHLIFARTVLVAKQDTKLIPILSLVGIGLHIIACFSLAPYLGMLGIAMGSVIAFSTEKLLLVFYLKLRHQISWQAYTHWGWWLGYTVLMVMAYWWTV